MKEATSGDAAGDRSPPQGIHPQVAAQAPRRQPGGSRRPSVHLHPPAANSARTTNAIERLHEEFKRRIKTQTVLPTADTAAMLFWALLASGQINMRKVDGWQTLATKPIDQQLTSQPETIPSSDRRSRRAKFQPHRWRHPARCGSRQARCQIQSGLKERSH